MQISGRVFCVVLGSDPQVVSSQCLLRFGQNGKITRTVSSVSLDGKSCCWPQTFESTKLLMVELTRCLGTFIHLRILSSEGHIHQRNVTKTKINDGLYQA